LRLPPSLVAEAEVAGATQTVRWSSSEGPATYSLAEYGPHWCFGRCRADEDHVRSSAAYDHFGAM
jgi:hypothetical protein